MSHRTKYGLFRTMWNYFTKIRPAAKYANENDICVGFDHFGNKYMIRQASMSFCHMFSRCKQKLCNLKN